MNLSPRYWLRRWLVPELEPSAQAMAECDAIRERMFATHFPPRGPLLDDGYEDRRTRH